MRVESENRPVLGQIYAQYEGVQGWERFFYRVTGSSLFIGGTILVLNAAGNQFPVEYALPPLILSSALTLPQIMSRRSTSLIAYEIARLEGVTVKNHLDIDGEKRLVNKAITISQPISPLQLTKVFNLQLLRADHTEYQLHQKVTEEQKQLFDSFDTLVEQELGYSPARARKTAGALELARFRWQQVLQNPLHPGYYQDFAQDMLSQIGARRSKLPSTFIRGETSA